MNEIIDIKSYDKIKIITLLLAMYGAVMSTYVTCRDELNEEEKFFIRSESLPVYQNDSIVGSYLVVHIQNIGRNKLQIMPNINVGMISGRSWDIPNSIFAFGIQIMPNCDRQLFETFIPSGLTKTVEPGETICARSQFLASRQLLNDANTYSINFGTADKKQFQAILKIEFVSIKQNSKEVIGNTCSGWAERVSGNLFSE